MLDHIGIRCDDFSASRAFYEKALAPLGFALSMHVTKEMTGDGSEHVGYGTKEKPFFWLSPGKPNGGVHIAFEAKDRNSIDAFYKAALAAGGKDNGAPGLRPHYHASYYGAFVIDPDGNNVEAVCHRP